MTEASETGAVVAVIPARGGSRGIPRKNLLEIGGRSLLAHAIDAGRDARLVDRVIVSTDDAEIAAHATRLGAEVPFERPSDLAQDDTPMISVLQHTIEHAGLASAEAIVLLQPTSPMRRAKHVDQCIEKFRNTLADAVVTVVAVPHHFTPSSLLVLQDGFVRPMEPGAAATRRQDKPLLYARNGPAVLVVTPTALAEGTLYGETTAAVVMSRLDSLDIDDEEDVYVARAILER